MAEERDDLSFVWEAVKALPYTSQAAGEQYLANVRIPVSDISPGTSSNGKVYLTVYKEDTVRFDEVNCDALYCLPIKDVQVVGDGLPLELNLKDYLGNIESIIQINEVSYSFEKEYLPQLKIPYPAKRLMEAKTPATTSSVINCMMMGTWWTLAVFI